MRRKTLAIFDARDIINWLVKAMSHSPKLGSRGKPEETRREILDAAIQEFAFEGVAGARTDSIAKAAGVNKALLYYYFGDKEDLYKAALEAVFSGLVSELHVVLQGPLPPGEKILHYALSHFDYIATHREYGQLVQYEMMRAQTGRSEHMKQMVQRFFKPLLVEVSKVLLDGASRGLFRKLDPVQFAVSLTGINVFYFISAPIQSVMEGADPFSPERLQQRRASAADMLASTLFTDVEHGRELANKVLSGWQFVPVKRAPRKVTRK
jgi:TetR/AcrR family transcriptional regulator